MSLKLLLYVLVFAQCISISVNSKPRLLKITIKNWLKSPKLLSILKLVKTTPHSDTLTPEFPYSGKIGYCLD